MPWASRLDVGTSMGNAVFILRCYWHSEKISNSDMEIMPI